MSAFTSRLQQLGEFEVGNAKFVVLDVRGGFVRCAQSHEQDGDRMAAYNLSFDVDGILDTSAAQTDFPAGFVVPQSHEAFNSVKADIADLDSRQLTLCAVCEGNGVTLADMTNACTSCVANQSTISYLKTV